jgi:hypothetical protein
MNKITARIDTIAGRRQAIHQLRLDLLRAREWTALDIADAHYEALGAQIDALLEMMKDLGPAMYEATDADIDARLAAAAA